MERDGRVLCLVSLGLMLSCPPPVVSSSSARLSNLGTLSTSSASASKLLQSSVPDPLTVGLKLMVTSFSKMSIKPPLGGGGGEIFLDTMQCTLKARVQEPCVYNQRTKGINGWRLVAHLRASAD